MSLPIRILLIIGSLVTGFYIRNRIRKSQMQIGDVLFWLFFAIALIFMSVFPEAVEWFTDLLGVQSPVNFVYLVVIFLVITRCFVLSVKVSQLEAKLSVLVEESSVEKTIRKLSDEQKLD